MDRTASVRMKQTASGKGPAVGKYIRIQGVGCRPSRAGGGAKYSGKPFSRGRKMASGMLERWLCG